MKLTDPIIPGWKPGWPLRTLSLVTFLLVFYFVPFPRPCAHKPEVTNVRGGVLVACLDPELHIKCRPYSFLTNQERITCRTVYHRPILLWNNEAIQKRRCHDELGELADFHPQRGCFCNYYSEERNGLCRLTDEACQELFGSGALAGQNELGLSHGCKINGSRGLHLALPEGV